MEDKIRISTLCLTAILLGASAQASDQNGQAIVRQKIERGAQACMAGQPAKVMESYARDILLQYPGIPDQDYATLNKGYRQLCGTGEGTVESTVPQFEEIYRSGTVVVARLIWTTRLRGMPPGTSRQLRDLQIWEMREGEWMFVRGVHYPVKPAS